MDLDSRDWLIVIGALIIVGVLLDAWRRYRNDRRNPIRMGRGTVGPGGGFSRDEPDTLSAELPGGGARVVERGQEPPPERTPPPRRRSSRVEPRVEPAAPPVRTAAVDVAPAEIAEPQPVLADIPAETVVAGATPAIDAAPILPDVIAGEPPPVRQLAPRPSPVPGVAAVPEREVLFVRVVCKGDGGFAGAELARIFKECDVRPGPQQVFQRTELARGEGAVQFTIFNGTAQGVFERELDESFTTRGLGFLMRLGEPQKPLEAFDCMLETARAVARYCDGELRDDTNSVFTQQTGEHCRERIRDFALRARGRR